MSNIKTVVHTYMFDTTRPKDKDAYETLKQKLKADGLKCFETWGGSKHYKPELDGVEVTLETKHLFNNQWNTDKGRLMDWAQDYPIDFPKSIKKGYWLEQVPEMAEVRRNRMACGYCGKQEPAQKGYVFCPHCIDSEYLKPSDLNLTRMQSVADTKDRAPLTEAERDHLLPLYRDAQLHGNTARGKVRVANKRASIEEEYRKAVHAATTERDGFVWLMDHGVNTENVIYYKHTDTFSFGWRKPLDDALLSDLLDMISEFSWRYEIVCADGRKLTGN